MAIQILGPPNTVFRWRNIDSLFANSVVELVFQRRNPKLFWSNNRRMLCTNSWNVLNSIPGKATLHFNPPTHPPPYNAAEKNLKTTWDILWQDWRNVNLDNWTPVAVLPVRNRPELEYFWQYFSDNIHPWNYRDKQKFMNRG